MSESNLTAIDGGKAYTVRELGTGDIFRAARLVAAVTNDNRIYHALGQTQPKFDDKGEYVSMEQNQGAIGVAMFGAAMDKAPDELQKFLADLVEMKVEDFDKLPITAVPDMLTEIAERESFPAFLESVSKLSGVAKKVFGNLRTVSNGNGV